MKKKTSKYEKVTTSKPLPPKEKDDAPTKKQENMKFIFIKGKAPGCGGAGGHGGSGSIEIKTEPTIKCEVCGAEFYPLKDDHYISREEEVKGAIASLATKEANLYDTFDCPQCGCQNIVAKRLRRYEESEEHKNGETDSQNA